MNPGPMKMNEVIQRRLAERLNIVLRRYRQKELEWQLLHHPVAEFEERAQHLRSSKLATRLEERTRKQLSEIESAMMLLQESEQFGICDDCGAAINPRRLEAMPTARRCIECAAVQESSPKPAASKAPKDEPSRAGASTAPSHDTPLPEKEQIAEEIRQFVDQDERLDVEELAVRQDGNRIILVGAMASETQKQILIHWLTDVLGIETVDDRLTINHQLFERRDRTEAEAERFDATEKDYHFHGNERVTENIQEAEQEDLPFVPSDRPLPYPQ